MGAPATPYPQRTEPGMNFLPATPNPMPPTVESQEDCAALQKTQPDKNGVMANQDINDAAFILIEPDLARKSNGNRIYARIRLAGKRTWKSTQTDDPELARSGGRSGRKSNGSRGKATSPKSPSLPGRRPRQKMKTAAHRKRSRNRLHSTSMRFSTFMLPPAIIPPSYQHFPAAAGRTAPQGLTLRGRLVFYEGSFESGTAF